MLTVEFTPLGIPCLGLHGDPDPAAAKRAFEAMLQRKKIDIAAIGAARRGRCAYKKAAAWPPFELSILSPDIYACEDNAKNLYFKTWPHSRGNYPFDFF